MGRQPGMGYDGPSNSNGGQNQGGKYDDYDTPAAAHAASKRHQGFLDRAESKRDRGMSGDAGYRAEQARAAKLAAERRKKAAEEAERKRKEQARQERFKKHGEDAANRQQRILLGELDDFEQGQINQSLTSMRKYKDQSGVAKWDLQEVADRPAYGLSRIAAIREGLIDDEETHNEYLGALKSELASKKYNANLIEATDLAHRGKYFSGDLMSGFRLITANI